MASLNSKKPRKMEDPAKDYENLRFIVFLLDTKNHDHDGYVFSRLQDAKNFLRENYEDGFYTKAVIGDFYLDKDLRESPITLIDTVGFKKKSPTNQLIHLKKKPEKFGLFC